MLVLQEAVGRAIFLTIPGIGEVRINILEGSRHTVRLGIEAPDSVIVDREEVHRRKIVQAAVKKERQDGRGGASE